MDLRRQPGTYLDLVDLKGEKFLIERSGKGKAVLLSLAEFEEYQRLKSQARKQAGSIIDQVRIQNKNVDPQEIEQKAIEVSRKVRLEQ